MAKLRFTMGRVCIMVRITMRYNFHGGGLVTKSCLTLMTPWTAACQTPLSMVFSRKEYWSGLPFPSPDNRVTGDLPNPGFEPRSPTL